MVRGNHWFVNNSLLNFLPNIPIEIISKNVSHLRVKIMESVKNYKRIKAEKNQTKTQKNVSCRGSHTYLDKSVFALTSKTQAKNGRHYSVCIYVCETICRMPLCFVSYECIYAPQPSHFSNIPYSESR